MKRRELWKMPTTIAAFCLAFALVLTGCDNPAGGGGGGGNHNLGAPPAYRPGVDGPAVIGANLAFTGSVYQWNSNDGTLYPFAGNLQNISAGFWEDGRIWIPVGGSGVVTNGQLNFNIGTPTATVSIGDFFDLLGFEFIWNNFTISNPNAQIAVIEELRTQADQQLLKGRFVTTATTNVHEWAIFVYAASNVTISGTGRNFLEPDGLRIITNTFTLNLQAGWNAFRLVGEEDFVNNVIRSSIVAGTHADAVWMTPSSQWTFSEATEGLQRSGRSGLRAWR